MCSKNDLMILHKVIVIKLEIVKLKTYIVYISIAIADVGRAVQCH